MGPHIQNGAVLLVLLVVYISYYIPFPKKKKKKKRKENIKGERLATEALKRVDFCWHTHLSQPSWLSVPGAEVSVPESFPSGLGAVGRYTHLL